MSNQEERYSWNRRDRKTLVNSKFIQVYEDTVEIPGASTVINDYTVVSLNTPVLVVAVDNHKRVIVLREYRYAHDEVMLSLPAGGIDNNETPVQAAERELLEETGYRAETFEYIGELNEYPTKLSHKTHVVLASGIEKIQEPRYEITEYVEKIELIDSNVALEMVKKNEIKTAVIAAALVMSLER